MSMLDYPALAALSAVLREGSFDKAATALGVTPSAVSQRLRGLEERLGTVLVVRGQPCTATATGARLCAHAAQVRLLEAELAAALPSLGDAAAGTVLPVAVNADSLATWFPVAAAGFAERSDALLDLLADDEAHTAGRLRAGEVFAAVTTDPTPVQGCRILPLGRLRYVAAAGPGFLRRHFPRGVDAAALARAPVLRFDGRDHMQDRWARAALGADLLGPAHRVPSTLGMLNASRAGLGWAMAPLPLAAPGLADGTLAEMLPDRPADVMLYWQHLRLGTEVLADLTASVRRAARAALLPPG